MIPWEALTIGLIRGLAGWRKAANKPKYKVSPKRFIASIGLAGLIGLILGWLTPADASVLIVVLGQVAAPWGLTTVIEQIYKGAQ